MIHHKDLSVHKTWQLIYASLFVTNLIFIPNVGGAFITAVVGVLFAFLFWGQKKAIDDIVESNEN